MGVVPVGLISFLGFPENCTYANTDYSWKLMRSVDYDHAKRMLTCQGKANRVSYWSLT